MSDLPDLTELKRDELIDNIELLDWWLDKKSEYIKKLEKENAQLKKWCEEFNALEVANENTKLKELLKECREILDYAKDFAYHDPCSKCITKIDQVLGEE